MYYMCMDTNTMTLTEAIISNGKVVDGSRYPRVIYEVHTSAIQAAVPHVKLMARTEFALVDHAYSPAGAQVICQCETLQDAIDAVEGR